MTLVADFEDENSRPAPVGLYEKADLGLNQVIEILKEGLDGTKAETGTISSN